MASSRILPSDYNISSFGNAGRDYTLLSTWATATVKNLVSAKKGEILNVFPDSISYNQHVALSGATTSAAYFRLIRGAPGYENQTIFAYTSTTFGDSTFILNEYYSSIYDISAQCLSSTTGALNIFNSNTSGGYNKFVGCKALKTTGTSAGYGFLLSNFAISYVINSYSGSNGFGYYLIYNIGYFYNCTAKNNTSYGFYYSSGAGYAKNCISEGNTVNWGETWSQTTCTNGAGVTFCTDGLHLSSLDSFAVNLGTNLSADAVYPFNDDIDLQTRPNGAAWDIGCDEQYLPTSPVLSSVISPTNTAYQTLSGTKTSGCGVYIIAQTGEKSLSVPNDSLTSWSILIGLRTGTTTFNLITIDSYGAESSSVPGSITNTSSRGRPFLYDENTFGGASRDYTLVSTWITATTANLVTNKKGKILTCYPDSASYDQRFTFSGATTNSSFFRAINAAPGYERQVIFNYTGSSALYSTIGITESNVGVYDLWIMKTETTSSQVSYFTIFINGAYSNIKISGCFIGPSSSSYSLNTAGYGIYNYNGGTNLVIANSIIYQHSVYSGIAYKGIVSAGLSSNSTYIYNVLIQANYIGIANTLGNITSKNTIIKNVNTTVVGVITQSNNAFSTGNGSVVFAVDGYHLSVSDTTVMNQGVDLSGDSIFPFADDIDKEIRPYGPSWDIGVDEYTVPNPPTLNSVMSPTTLFSQILSGNKVTNTSVLNSGVIIWALDSTKTWNFNLSLLAGLNNISLTARSVAGVDSTSTTTSSIVVSPLPPTVDTYINPTSFPNQIVSGTRPIDSSVYCNEILISASDSTISWAGNISLLLGDNNLSFTTKYSNLYESSSVLIDIIRNGLLNRFLIIS